MSLGEQLCPLLREFSMKWIGVKDCGPNYHISIQTPTDYALSVMISGSGQIQFDGRWETVHANQAIIFPAGALRALRVSQQPWQYCTILYGLDASRSAPTGFDSTHILEVDAAPFVALIRMVCREWLASTDQEIVRHLLHALDQYARRLADPHRPGPSLMELWDRVNADLARPWDVTTLADLAGMSITTLRRKCRQELNCSPMDQVTRLRMGRASSLLAAERATVAEAASAVGYENAFAFSRAFKRVIGMAPKPYQMQRHLMVSLDVEERIAKTIYQNRKETKDPAKGAFPMAVGLEREAFHCIEMEHLFNRKLDGEGEVWLGDQPLEHLQTGLQVYHGVPFDVRNGATIFANSRSAALSALPNKVVISCRKQVRAVYVLHACGWAEKGQRVARWHFLFGRGLSEMRDICVLEPGSAEGMIADWWPNEPARAGVDAMPVIVNSPNPRDTYQRRLYVAQWCNPRPTRTLEKLELQVPASTQTVYGILAITLLLS